MPLVEANAAILMQEKSIDVHRLANLLDELNIEKLSEMALSAHRLAKPDAADRIAETCIHLIEGGVTR